MNYCLFKLRFKSALHIGCDSGMSPLSSSETQIHSDTLFSSLCIEALQDGGQRQLERLYGEVSEGRLNFSDALPYCGEELYLPRPYIGFDTRKALIDSLDAKKLKRLAFVPASEFKAYLDFMSNEEDGVGRLPENTVFGVSSPRIMAAVRGNEDTIPFYVGSFEFLKDCGLYVITAYEAEEQLALMEKLLRLLSYGGIGGKRSAGMGSFELSERILFGGTPFTKARKWLCEALNRENADFYMTLNVSLPRDEELDGTLTGGFYSLTRRGGFVQSQEYARANAHEKIPLKKRVMYFLSTGSCVRRRFEGDIYDVAIKGPHPVYRMAKPLFMGVDV